MLSDNNKIADDKRWSALMYQRLSSPISDEDQLISAEDQPISAEDQADERRSSWWAKMMLMSADQADERQSGWWDR